MKKINKNELNNVSGGWYKKEDGTFMMNCTQNAELRKAGFEVFYANKEDLRKAFNPRIQQQFIVKNSNGDIATKDEIAVVLKTHAEK